MWHRQPLGHCMIEFLRTYHHAVTLRTCRCGGHCVRRLYPNNSQYNQERKASVIKLSDRARRAQRLVRFARSHAQKPSGRRLCCAPRDGSNNCEIAEAVGASRQTVRTWRERFAKYRLRGLHDEPIKMATAGLKRSFQGRLEVKPANAAHRSTRGMARASGVSSSSSRTFKLSTHSHG